MRSVLVPMLSVVALLRLAAACGGSHLGAAGQSNAAATTEPGSPDAPAAVDFDAPLASGPLAASVTVHMTDLTNAEPQDDAPWHPPVDVANAFWSLEYAGGRTVEPSGMYPVECFVRATTSETIADTGPIAVASVDVVADVGIKADDAAAEQLGLVGGDTYSRTWVTIDLGPNDSAIDSVVCTSVQGISSDELPAVSLNQVLGAFDTETSGSHVLVAAD